MEGRLESVQTAVTVAAVAALALGFLASVGLRIVPPLAPAAFWPVGVLLTVLGAAGGVATVLRGRQVDRVRWEVVEDPLITSGERAYAHKEAERQRRWAGTVFFAAPIALAYWASYQFPDASGAATSPLLALFPLIGYLAGLVITHRLGPDRPEGLDG